MNIQDPADLFETYNVGNVGQILLTVGGIHFQLTTICSQLTAFFS